MPHVTLFLLGPVMGYRDWLPADPGWEDVKFWGLILPGVCFRVPMLVPLPYFLASQGLENHVPPPPHSSFSFLPEGCGLKGLSSEPAHGVHRTLLSALHVPHRGQLWEHRDRSPAVCGVRQGGRDQGLPSCSGQECSGAP